MPNLQKSSTLKPPKPTSLETPTHTSHLLTAPVTQLTTLAESTTASLPPNVSTYKVVNNEMNPNNGSDDDRNWQRKITLA